MNLVIVESPAKAKTIEGFLGKDFKVIATIGHLIDLPRSRLGVDTEKNYAPEYEVMKGKQKIVTALKKAIKNTDGDIYLAPDPDREGESIAWQVQEKFKLESNYHRIAFHEITKTAVTKAIKDKHKINPHLVDAQKARRVLDRLVGYPLSQLIWKKIRYGLSAGRVQSAALRLIVEREKEILAFIPEEYWEISARVRHNIVPALTVKLNKKDGKKISIHTGKESGSTVKELEKAKWQVENVTLKDSLETPAPPFITATLQQTANRALGYSAKQTMSVAQRLYQGLEIKGIGHKSLITYMRTDSVAMSKEAIKKIRQLITKEFGKSHLEDDVRHYRNKTRLAQEAHESIRPTYFDLPPKKIKGKVSSQEYSLYKLIWNRAVATQMKQARYKIVKLSVLAKGNKSAYQFLVQAKSMTFAGFRELQPIPKEATQLISDLEKLKAGDPLSLIELLPDQLFTKPRGRYSDASLIKKLKDFGIGRPSTYASIISTLIARDYVNRLQKLLQPTDVGIVVSDFLVAHFNNIVDYEFTADMEQKLDDIAAGKVVWHKPINDFWGDFKTNIDTKMETIDKQDIVKLGKSDKKCPECKGTMEIRLGRYGKFHSCKKYPDCKGILPFEDANSLDENSDEFKAKYEPAPVVDGDKLELKKGRFGYFWAHPDYPNKKVIQSLLLQEKCPECNHNLVERKSKYKKVFLGCSNYPKCKHIKKSNQN